MSEHVLKSHNKTLLMYHLVCPAKYRRKVFSDGVEESIKEICLAIDERYEIHFIEIGTDEDHVHFLLQSVPVMAPERIAKIIKSITAKEIFKRHPEVRRYLWGGHFWTSGYYMNTVGAYANEKVIKDYVAKQGGNYRQVYRGQLELFDQT
ncbi:IS200/IS605 family transposase [Candidatus Pacearchaeota archaeon]|nr:IS200/IS605 family transposase [Candidatus Omnitrophota bacterium]MCK5617676.1 IS200/IS605 family transposase [Candidatus Pacearchaeota archaeon]